MKLEINKKLKDGFSKDVIYADLAGKVDDNRLRRLLSSRPTETSRNKVKGVHRIVIGLWILFIFLELLGVMEDMINMNFKGILSLILTTLVFIQVWKLNGDVILPAAIWLGLGVVRTIIELQKLPTSTPDYDFIMLLCYIYVCCIVLCIVLMYFLRKKIFNYYLWFKPRRDIDGNYVFQAEDVQVEMV